MVYKFFDEKTESAVGETDNEELSQKLHRPMAKKFKRGKVCVRGLNIIFGQQIYLKWDHYPLRIED